MNPNRFLDRRIHIDHLGVLENVLTAFRREADLASLKIAQKFAVPGHTARMLSRTILVN